MTLRLTSIAMLAISALVLLFEPNIWVNTFAASFFILGFMILGLDLLRANIVKTDS
jgi:hypothetical protein